VILFTLSIVGTAFAEERGEAIFKGKCATCHGVDGTANTPVARSSHMRPFKDPELMKWTDAQFIDFATRAYKNTGLSDAQIKDTVAYIRKLQR
jgi:mono/diheme cytochrome c family protein